jgi:hypothetical protein
MKRIRGAKRIESSKSVLGIYAPHGESFDLTGDFEAAKAACRDVQGVADAVGLLDAMSDDKRGRTSGFAKAVYVISVMDDPIAKIGVSANPIRRHADLQASHYRELVLNAVVFCPKHNAVAIEQEVLRRAREAGDGLMGEWIAADPDDVLHMVMEAAVSLDVPICDGRQWFDNQFAKARALAKQKYSPTNRARMQATNEVIRASY